ncbi:hypothetical protein KKC59_00730 [bacterium]|nr:hypothetical protein [bacterium]
MSVIAPYKVMSEKGEEIVLHNNSRDVICCVSKIVGKQEKEAVSQKYPEVCCVDMESFYFADELKGRDICIIKSMSDNLNFVMPCMEIMLKYFNRFRFYFFVDMFLRPAECWRVVKLKVCCVYAAYKLALAVKNLI